MARLTAILDRTWVLGALVALASWDVLFTGAAPGNDGNWVVGLYLAAEQGLRFGEQLIFTYGPLGFLSPLSPTTGGLAVVVDDGLAQLAFLYGATIHVLLCLSLVWALRRRFGAAAAVLVSFATVAAFPAIDSAQVLAAIWCLAALSEDSPLPRRIVIFGGGALAAVETLVRLTSGPVILAMCALAVAFGGRGRRDLLPLLATFAGVVSLLWFASGQALANVPDYVSSGIEVVLGYSQGMARAETGLEWDLAEAAGALAVVGLAVGAFLSTTPRRRQLTAAAVMFLPAFAAFKEGVVREDRPHLSILFATALGLALAIPWRREWRWPAAASIAALAALAFAAAPRPGPGDLDPIERANNAVKGLRNLTTESRLDRLETIGRTFVTGHAALDPRTLKLLEGQEVHVDPSGAGVVWGYGYHWRPLPVFQANLAYTSELDEENADFLASEDGPERVLRGTPEAVQPGATEPIDGRFAAWNPPAVAVTMLCSLRTLHATERWQVLEPRSDRCGEERPLGTVETSFGELVEVPRAGPREAVLARVDGAEVSGLERLRSFLLRARLRFVEVNGAASYRLVPGTADDGLIMSVPPGLDFPSPFSLSPGARTIELTGSEGELRVEFYALPLRR